MSAVFTRAQQIAAMRLAILAAEDAGNHDHADALRSVLTVLERAP